MLMRSRATDGRSASRCQQKWSDAVRSVNGCNSRPRRQPVLLERGESAKNSPEIESHLGNPGYKVKNHFPFTGQLDKVVINLIPDPAK